MHHRRRGPRRRHPRHAGPAVFPRQHRPRAQPGPGTGAAEQGGFPLLLVGTDVAQAIRGAEELDTRAGLHHEFETIPKGLVVVVVRQMDPRLAATQARTLEVLNARYCKGNLRRWRNLLKNITDLRAPGDQTGITVEEAKDLLTLAGKR